MGTITWIVVVVGHADVIMNPGSACASALRCSTRHVLAVDRWQRTTFGVVFVDSYSLCHPSKRESIYETTANIPKISNIHRRAAIDYFARLASVQTSDGFCIAHAPPYVMQVMKNEEGKKTIVQSVTERIQMLQLQESSTYFSSR